MAEHTDSRDGLINGLKAEMPPAPSEGSLQRVRARAAALARPQREPRVSAWRLAGLTATAAAAVAVVVLVLAPRMGTAAFARDAAADALLLQTDGRVLHVVMTYNESGSGEGFEPRFALNQRWSFWVDPDGRRIREEFVNLSDGSLDNMSVRIGDRIVVFQNNWSGGRQQLIDEKKTQQPFGTALGTMIDYVRARIVDGTAKVTGTEVIDGEEYWVVQHRPQAGELLTVTMRTSDYRLATWKREFTFENENGKGEGVERVRFETVEQIDPDSLEKDFFSFDEVFEAAKPGTHIENR